MRAIDADALIEDIRKHSASYFADDFAHEWVDQQPTIEPEIVRCKDCKFYSPMNKETKTGICNLTMHQNFGDDWFCAGAERRTDATD